MKSYRKQVCQIIQVQKFWLPDCFKQGGAGWARIGYIDFVEVLIKLTGCIFSSADYNKLMADTRLCVRRQQSTKVSLAPHVFRARQIIRLHWPHPTEQYVLAMPVSWKQGDINEEPCHLLYWIYFVGVNTSSLNRVESPISCWHHDSRCQCLDYTAEFQTRIPTFRQRTHICWRVHC